MGHERVGMLPKTDKWRRLVESLAVSMMSPAEAGEIASQTIHNVRQQYQRIMFDDGVKAAFKFLIILSIFSKKENPSKALADVGIHIEGNPTPLATTKAAHQFIRENYGLPEYARIAQYATGDALVSWHRNHQPKQTTLFDLPEIPYEIWQKSGNGAGFCELSRLFFAKFTERYLNYFLEREATAAIASISERDAFSRSLDKYLGNISQHAFETSKITQSFAAGWYNRYSKDDVPSDKRIEAFLVLAFEKMREELYRETEYETNVS